MRVVTQNLWGRRGAWADRRRVLIDGLQALQPDLVAFQEAIKNDEYDQVSDLLGPDFHVAHQMGREPGGPSDVEAGQGISIASRWPSGEVRELDCQRKRHIVLAGDFDADPNAASVRFWSGRQSLGGISVCYRDAWESTHPGEPGHTFTSRNPLMSSWDWPFQRIDYIFVRCGKHGGPTLAISACSRIFDEPADGVWASDHFGVVADLAVPPQGPVGLS